MVVQHLEGNVDCDPLQTLLTRSAFRGEEFHERPKRTPLPPDLVFADLGATASQEMMPLTLIGWRTRHRTTLTPLMSGSILVGNFTKLVLLNSSHFRHSVF